MPRWGVDLFLAVVVLAVGLQLGLGAGPRGYAMLVAEAALLAASGHAYVGLHRRQHDLTLVHEFVANGFGQSDVAHELVLPGGGQPRSELAPGADLLDRARIFMQAECAELVVDDGYGQLTRLRLRAPTAADGLHGLSRSAGVVEVDNGGAVLSDWLLLRSCEQGEALLVTDRMRDHSLRQWLAAGDTRDALLAPVRQAQGSAVLVMRNRTRRQPGGPGTRRTRGRRGGYTYRDLALLENVAGHFTGALQTNQVLYQLRYDASHDPLTGLSNRTVLCARLDGELEDAAQGGSSPLAVLLLDLDRFKEVNDTLGHHVGDLLLQVVAERLRTSLPASATIARLGGDEFAIVLAGLAEPDRDARRYAEAIIAALALPVRLDDALLTSAVSIGIALAEYETSSSELLRHADTAMYTAKTGSEPVVVYSASLDYGRAERLALAADLQHAIEGDQFLLLFQPKLSLKTNSVIGVEALVRWQHPQLGLLEPDAFIPLAEATGLVEPLTRIVLTKALRQCRDWAREGLALSVSVNLPARSVANPALPAAVMELLWIHEVEASQLILEITEASVMDDPERSVPVLQKLAATGVTLSLDDFGTGYASLSFLQRLPVRELKIDRSFVTGLADPEAEPASTLLVHSILSLATGMALRVVAEGVEDQECLEALHELGVDVAQGFHVGRPMEAQQLLRLLDAHPQGPLTPHQPAPSDSLPPPRDQLRLPSS